MSTKKHSVKKYSVKKHSVKKSTRKEGSTKKQTIKQHISYLKKTNLAQKLLKQGINAASYILLNLKDGGKDLLEELPNSYPGFALMKWMFDVGPYNKNKKIELKARTVRNNLSRLVKDGLITKDPKEKIYFLTDKGKEFVAYIENRFLILQKPWDGKLRIVIFDIPERKKNWRRVIRKELSLMQFEQLQKSVYVGKYPLSETFCKEIEEAGLGQYIFIFTVDKVDRKKEILDLLNKKGNY